MQKYNSRKEVPKKYQWDLTEYFKDEDDFEASYKKAQIGIKELDKYKNCFENSKKVYEYLQKEIETLVLVQDLFIYATIMDDQEVGVTSSIERKNKVEHLDTEFSKATGFFAPELLKLSSIQYDELFKDCEKLIEFKPYLDKIYREKEYILSEKEEQMITELVNSMNHFSDMASTLLYSEHHYGIIMVDGEEEILAPNNYIRFLKNRDSSIRKQAYQLFNKKIDEYAKSSASFLHGYVAMNQTVARLHGYQDAWHKKLFGLNLTDKVFKTLVTTTENHLDSLHKYYQLRKKVLGFDLYPYDLNLNMINSKEEYTIEEAQNIVRGALEKLGEDYLEKYDSIIKNRYIDYCQYSGKCAGGYNISGHDKNSRILMSFNGNLASLSTIAHECGHHINHQMIMENNKVQYRGLHIIVAEVASLVNEFLLSDYIFRHAKTKNEKLLGLENIIHVIVSNLYGAVREGKMEEEMYQSVLNNNIITKDYMDNLTRKSFEKYYGSYVKLDEYSNSSWATRSHYFMNFYLYSYAICISVATMVASKILKGEEEMLNRYLEFLKVGNDKWPKEAFEVLGVDLEDPKVYEDAISYFDSLLKEYENIYYEK